MLTLQQIDPKKFVFYEKQLYENDDKEEIKGGLVCKNTENGWLHIREIKGMMGNKPNTVHTNIGINKFLEEVTEVPPEYKVVDNPCESWIKKYFYNPNLKYVIPTKVPEYDETHYFTHDNGNRPFVIYISDNTKTAVVYKIPSDDEDFYIPDKHAENKDAQRQLYSKKVYKCKYETVFIGKSPLNKMTEYSGGHGPDFDGNSILLHLGGLDYVHISVSIKKFTTLSSIVSYYSPIGNNDVPYPYAEDDQDRVYLLLDDVIMENPDADDIYDLYYAHNKMLSYDCVNFADHEYKDYKGFYIDDESYLLRWVPRPAEEYERLLKFNDDESVGKISKLSLLRKDGTEEVLTKEKFITLNEEFGRERRFSSLETEIIEKRVW